MLKLFPFVKKYLWLIAGAIVLLFIQANADLALPDYLSRIVNNGIQQSGVEEPVPQAMREETFQRLHLFTDQAAAAALDAAYQRVEASAPQAAAYLDEYPALAETPIYVLRADLDEAARQELETALVPALVTLSGLERALQDPQAADRLGQQMGFDLNRLPPGMDLFDALAQMPPAQREQMLTQMQTQLDALGENMLRQMAIQAVRTEYEALGVDMAALQSAYILRTGALMLLLTLVSIASAIGAGFLAARTAAAAARDIRRALFSKVVQFSSAEFNRFSTASLITRSTNDVTQLQTVTYIIIRMVFYAPLLAIGGVLHALDTAPSMWWIIAITVGVLLLMIALIFGLSLPKFRIMQDLIDRLNLVLRENLTGMMVVRAFNKQKYEEKRFDQANRDLTRTSLFVSRVMAFFMPSLMFVMNGASLLIIWVGAHRVAEAAIQVGDMMAFLQYAMQIVFGFLMMSMMFIFLPRAFVAGDRIAEVLDTPLTVTDPPQPKSFPEPFRGEVEFRHVSFRYPGAEEDVLHDISFTARPGQLTAFIGSTGSGKSTVVNLIPRFYDVTEGAILIDGVDIREVRQADLRARIGYVPQQGVLFSGTIADNLRYADENASEDQMREAIETAQAADFVFSRPEGLNYAIAQGGANVSGGQKQRLAIARALTRRAPIYIFDDSFSALDYKTDKALRRALREKAAGSTVLLVTQRVATAMHADQIVVLERGRVAGIGSHETLMKTNQTYREIALSQLKQEELQ